MMPLLEVKNLKMHYKTRKGWVRAVDDVSFDLNRGEALGLVGESGCGKTSVAFSIIKLLPSNGRFVSGQILLNGENLLLISKEEMRKIRGTRISMIFQSAMNALDPVQKIENQLTEILRTHQKITRSDAKKRVGELFELVDLPPSRINSYPHEFSGGMKQRAIIAMSLLCGPELIIADEPTTALDVVVQNKILRKIKDLQRKLNLSMIIVSHDISIIAETCDKIAIMYGGKLVELADSISIFKNSHHPYTIALLQAFPNIHGPKKKLISLPGNPPNLINTPVGCRFAPRCPVAKEACAKKEPPLRLINRGHYSYCHCALDPQLKEIKFEEVTSN